MPLFNVHPQLVRECSPVRPSHDFLLLASWTIVVWSKGYLSFEVLIMPELRIVDYSLKIELAERSFRYGRVDCGKP